MAEKYKYLNSLVGQTEIKREMSFYLDSFRRDGYFMPMITCGARGLGKTLIVKALAAEMNDINKSKGIAKGKRFLMINSAEVRGSEAFLDKVLPTIAQEGHILLFFDELNGLSMEVQTLLLSLLSVGEDRKSHYYTTDGTCYTINHEEFTFCSAASSVAQIHPDLLDRLKRFQMQVYNSEQLAQIIQKKAKGITFDPDALARMAATCRNNARNAVFRAQDLIAYGEPHFTIQDFNKLKRILSIYPFGLNRGEVEVLKHLSSGPKTLTELSAKMNCTRDSLMQDLEQRLKACSLIKTAGARGRIILPAGLAVLKEIEEEFS
jgi:Holliday junction resolvasome RuvABC ATP-dependent DNA helicase subunit